MDKYLDARFERVERALASLIDSITKYNPSEKLGEELIAADRELAAGLQALETHHNNYARIQQLRAETAALDAQTKDIIGALWAMRKEVKNTHTTVYAASGPKYQFTTAELLDYARRISSTTLPPQAAIIGAADGAAATAGAAGTSPDADDAARSSQGGQTPTASFGATPVTAGTPMGGGGQAPPTPAANGETQTQTQSQTTVTSTFTELPMHIKPAVNLGEGAVFYPWPVEEKIRMGALSTVDYLSTHGIDPRGYDPEEEEQRKKEEEQARKEAEERARQEREEAERRMHEERERMARERERSRAEAERRSSVATGFVQAPAKAQFTFLDGLDDDDDDD
ncbi:vitamin-D-receptor interacting mediator subunit 4-domain-containing protein [Lasiosphaeria miniovina]|uniref:Mediator of RNA polymerase II transcription subunit 4 n=1 Tax=Lasiosphaeria miniovina TaxID=1954250 RepID=A0AA40AU37_9PEZI|nr:vitamin-D-receptor interacting mediator subunit 4-domain-containing protein [Lasiosphaeria miniovina]KAK0721949.1 vitamin-D-receptor interacting mediator subunit 4-domain-containing protein [Lasiosphaeria miniovina]